MHVSLCSRQCSLVGLFTYNDAQSMLREVAKMDSLGDHPNVMPLLGVCMDAGPGISLILPFMEKGSLLDYLRKERSSLVIPEDHGDSDVSRVISFDYYSLDVIASCFPVAGHACYEAPSAVLFPNCLRYGAPGHAAVCTS